MQHETVRYHGSYRYADRPALERALMRARAELDDEDLDRDHGWLRCFITHGTQLSVNLELPAIAEHRFAAANVLLILAHGAIEGAVEARQHDRTVDLFASGDDD